MENFSNIYLCLLKQSGLIRYISCLTFSQFWGFNIVLTKQIPDDARSNAWVSFDGKRRQQLSRGDSVRIFMSEHPIPTVNKSDQTGDWFHSLVRCLNWNERLDQKALWSLQNRREPTPFPTQEWGLCKLLYRC